MNLAVNIGFDVRPLPQGDKNKMKKLIETLTSWQLIPL
jgi:hypothetical protein